MEDQRRVLGDDHSPTRSRLPRHLQKTCYLTQPCERSGASVSHRFHKEFPSDSSGADTSAPGLRPVCLERGAVMTQTSFGFPQDRRTTSGRATKRVALTFPSDARTVLPVHGAVQAVREEFGGGAFPSPLTPTLVSSLPYKRPGPKRMEKRQQQEQQHTHISGVGGQVCGETRICTHSDKNPTLSGSLTPASVSSL